MMQAKKINSKCISVFLTAILLLPLFVGAQTDTISLKEVAVNASRITNSTVGYKSLKTDSATFSNFQNNNLADLLSQNNTLYIKSYGRGSVATSSLRGASASQTAVLWNGFNINNPMLGLSDLSLFSLNLFNGATIQYGSSASSWGSGSLGGSIHLNNNYEFDKGLHVKLATFYGSFNEQQQNADVVISKKRFISSTKVFYHSAENNFPYYNTTETGKPLQTQKHAQLKQYGLMQENYFLISSRQKLTTRFWYQNNDRNIPPTLSQTINTSTQNDLSYRGTAEWQRTGNKVVWLMRSALFNDNIRYVDTTYKINESSTSTTSISEAESRVALSKQHQLNFIINNTYYKAYTESYKTTREQDRIALFAAYHFSSKNERFKASANVRQEFLKDKNIPLTWSLSSELKVVKWLAFTANVNKVFRLPTLNDLYWNPGGNPALKPEDGYSEDIGMNIVLTAAHFSFRSQINIFNRNINNWIMWVPGNNGIYSPQNSLQVWSRGIESKWDVVYSKNKFSAKLNINSSYVITTNEKANGVNDPTFQKLLIYTPQYTGSANLTFAYKKMYFNYNHTYTGYRYTLADNTEFLKPFTTANIQVSYEYQIKKTTLGFIGKMYNIFNTQYQVIQNYAMPMRSMQVGLIVNYK